MTEVVNLLEETEKVLARLKLDPKDVQRIVVYNSSSGMSDFRDGAEVTWERFRELADFTYNRGFGSADVVEIVMFFPDVIVFRDEYDGSEWWESFDLRALRTQPVQTLKVGEAMFARKVRRTTVDGSDFIVRCCHDCPFCDDGDGGYAASCQYPFLEKKFFVEDDWYAGTIHEDCPLETYLEEVGPDEVP